MSFLRGIAASLLRALAEALAAAGVSAGKGLMRAADFVEGR